MKMKLELVPVPVTDVDRTKSFYVDQVGFQADLDIRPNEAVGIVQLTPLESACSIVIGTGLPGIAATWLTAGPASGRRERRPGTRSTHQPRR